MDNKNLKAKAKPKSKQKFRFYWKKGIRPTNSDTLYVNVKTATFIGCSIVSGFINLVFISNLTKSPYTVGTLLTIPGAVLLGLMSIWLDVSKCLHSIQINTLSELIRKLSGTFKETAKKLKRARSKWIVVYVLYVTLSIVTSMSLSTISIGEGITRNANTLKQIDEFILQGETYSSIDSTAKNVTMQNLIGKATDTSEQDAIMFAREKMADIRIKVEEYKAERDEFENAGYAVSSVDEIDWNGSKIIPSKYWDQRNREINILLQNAGYGSVTGTQIKNLNLTAVENKIKENYYSTSKTASNDEATKRLEELTDSTMDEAYAWIITLNTVGFVNPKTNELVVFDTDQDKSTKILVSAALMRLKALRVDVENDSGDIGKSAKIFMQLGSKIDGLDKVSSELEDALKVKSSGSLGTTETLMMGMLLFLSLLIELAINQFSTKTKITRKMLGQFSEYLPANFDINRFMLRVYIDDFNTGDITKEELLEKSKECVSMLGVTEDYLIDLFTDKPKKKVEVATVVPERDAVPERDIQDIVIKTPEVAKAPKVETPEREVETQFGADVDNLVNEIQGIIDDDREAGNR